MNRFGKGVLVAFVLLLAACGVEGSDGGALPQPTLPPEVAEQVLDDATRAGGGYEPIISDTKEVRFSDASADCPSSDPQPGGETGYQITVDVGSRELNYLVTGDGEVLVCAESGLRPLEAVEGAMGDDPSDGAGTTLAGGGDEYDSESPADAVSPGVLTQALLDAIVADAAQRAGVAPSEVVVLSSEQQIFNDSSLGCPEPGRVYTQVLTPGHRVLVDAGGETYDYRVNSLADTYKLCE